MSKSSDSGDQILKLVNDRSTAGTTSIVITITLTETCERRAQLVLSARRGFQHNGELGSITGCILRVKTEYSPEIRAHHEYVIILNVGIQAGSMKDGVLQI